MLRTVIVVSLAVLLSAYFLPGVNLDAPLTALFVGVVLIILNSTVKPVLSILTFPINFLTLGLVSLVINIVIVLIADYLIEGLVVENFLWALVFSLIVSAFTSWLGNSD